MKEILHPQLQQFLNLVILLFLGKYAAHIYLPWERIVLVLLFAAVLEHILRFIRDKRFLFFPFSSLSTAIGVMLMLVTPHLWVLLLLIGLGLLQKYLFHYRGAHLFNPSNFALMMGLLFFYRDAHIVLGQLGEHTGLAVLTLLLGAAILYRVDRWVIPLVFGVSYLFLQYVMVVQSDPVLLMEEVYYRFYSVSFIVFILFMLTDPQTTPQLHWQQALFALMIALGATLLDYLVGFRVQHLFMILFVLSPLVPILRGGKNSEWQVERNYISIVMLFLALGAIIYIEMQPPYYFEMNR